MTIRDQFRQMRRERFEIQGGFSDLMAFADAVAVYARGGIFKPETRGIVVGELIEVEQALGYDALQRWCHSILHPWPEPIIISEHQCGLGDG